MLRKALACGAWRQIPRLSAPAVLCPVPVLIHVSPKPTSHLAIPPPPLIPAPLLYSRMRIPTVPVTFIHTLRQKLDEILKGPGVDSIGNSPTIDGKTADLCEYYSTLIPEDRTSFLKTLATDYGVDHAQVQQLASHLATAKDRGYGVLLRAEERLRHALIPRYQHLFTKISHQHHGVKFLVDLRTDLLSILQSKGPDHDNPYLSALNVCLRDLLSLWFSVGFFKLERVTWESPCDMLQKISEYEAVHPIRNWTDLKRRVGSYRRCFVFTHHSMPREPVVVLHTALTNNISSSIQSIVSRTVSSQEGTQNAVSNSRKEREKEEASVSTAIFYSITSTQRGLTGVEIGNYLIKSAVRELLSEFPKMHQFSSLSPIPGYREWLLGEINTFLHHQANGEDTEQHLFTEAELTQFKSALECPSGAVFDSLKKVLTSNNWINNDRLTTLLKEPLMRLCARYLYVEKRRGFAYNPVANFHLRNGAVLWRINWLADVTPRGLGASCSMMVNYRYFLEETEQNSRTYMETQQIVVSDQVLALVKDLPQRPIPRARLNSQGSTSSAGSATTSSG